MPLQFGRFAIRLASEGMLQYPSFELFLRMNRTGILPNLIVRR
jgi:hypothetical protein